MEPIRPKKTLVEETYDILLDAICTRELLPGQRLNQDDIAARLKVSRQPVNSAIAILKADRLVEDTQRRGVVVSAIDPEFIRAITEYRELVEPFSAESAARNISLDARETAQAIIKKGRAAVEKGDIKELLTADRAFHEMIYSWGGNTVIQNSMHSIWNHIRRAMAEVLSDPDQAISSWDEHEAIIAAVLSGQAKLAGEQMRAHIQTAYARNFANKGHDSPL